MNLQIEGYSLSEIIALPLTEFDQFVLTDEPIVFRVGSAEVLGQFAVKDHQTLIVELAQIDGGGEGILPAVQRIAKHICRQKGLSQIDCIVHAIHCAKPNLKLRAHLLKRGFVIQHVAGKGEAYYKQFQIAAENKRT